jgi:polar amino acid transport system permease protein
MWNWSFAWSIIPQIAHGLKVTVEATMIGSLIAVVVGAIILAGRTLLPRPLAAIVRLASEIVRRTPLIVQLYFIFYGLPSVGITLPAFSAGVIGLGIYYSAYVAEVYRAGILSVPRGQWDASVALDLPRTTVWTTIVAPQALRPILPALGNQVIAMFKDSAVLSVITVTEMMATARDIGANYYDYLEPLSVAAAFYFAVSFIAARGVGLAERKLHV